MEFSAVHKSMIPDAKFEGRRFGLFMELLIFLYDPIKSSSRQITADRFRSFNIFVEAIMHGLRAPPYNPGVSHSFIVCLNHALSWGWCPSERVSPCRLLRKFS